MKKAKVLILQNEISAYNVSTYNIISDFFDLTLGYYTKDTSKIKCKFDKVKFEIKKFGSLIFIPKLRDYCNKFDAVIILPDMHVLSYCLIPFVKRRYKTLSWGIGFRVSYIHPFITKRKHRLADLVYQAVISACDANIFYMDKSKEFWEKTRLNMSNIFVAINTTDVDNVDFIPSQKKDLLFVGTLYKGKGLDLLLKAFNSVIKERNIDYKLRIVGDGTERESLEQYVISNNLTNNVVFHGAIYDEKQLASIFQSSLLCISPTQGGLSIPKSMGYGVPFVTKKDAITGGEIYHITSGVNGIIYESNSELLAILNDVIDNKDRYVEMGRLAKEYYYNHATVAHMAKGAIDAINYALEK